MTQLINSGNVEDNSRELNYRNRTGKGARRVFAKREERPARPNHQRSEQSKTKSKDSEIRLLRKILADNGIEV